MHGVVIVVEEEVIARLSEEWDDVEELVLEDPRDSFLDVRLASRHVELSSSTTGSSTSDALQATRDAEKDEEG